MSKMTEREAIRELREMQEGIKYHGLKGQHFWGRRKLKEN